MMDYVIGFATGVAAITLVALVEYVRSGEALRVYESVSETFRQSIGATIPWVVPPAPSLTRTRSGLAELTQTLTTFQEAVDDVYQPRHSYDKKREEPWWRWRWAMFNTQPWPGLQDTPERGPITAGDILDMRPVICLGRGAAGELPLATWTSTPSKESMLELLS